VPKSDDDPVGLVEHALAATLESEPVDAKVRAAIKAGTLAAQGAPGEPADAVLARAEAAGIISAAGHALVRRQRLLAARLVRVDDFAQDLGAAEMEPPNPVTPHDADVAQSPPRVRAVA
jgi:acyl-CoA dehydrogenase